MPMTAPTFSPQFNYGTIVQLAVLLVAGGVLWGAMQSQTAAILNQTAAMERQMIEMEVRLRSVEQAAARNEARTEQQIHQILTAVQRIEQRLDRADRFRQEGGYRE